MKRKIAASGVMASTFFHLAIAGGQTFVKQTLYLIEVKLKGKSMMSVMAVKQNPV